MPTKAKTKQQPTWAQIGILLFAPFFLPAVMVQSVLFAPISAVAFIWFYWLRPQTHLLFLAFLSNSALLLATRPVEYLFWFLPYWISTAWVFRTLVIKKIPAPKALLLSIASIFLSWVAVILALKIARDFSFINWLRGQIIQSLEMATMLESSWMKKAIEEQGVQGFGQWLSLEIPSLIVVVMVFAVYATFWVASKWIYGFLTRAFWLNLKFPFECAWVTLAAAGMSLVIPVGSPFQWYGTLLLKGMLAVHSLQGISVAAHMLTKLKLNRLIQWFVISLTLVGATPIIVGLGFFDLWFDFRRKVAL
jgi:hypothetical protein